MDFQEHIYKEMDFKDLNIDMFLEVHDQTYSQILYLIEYNADGVHFCIKINNLDEKWASGSRGLKQYFRKPPRTSSFRAPPSYNQDCHAAQYDHCRGTPETTQCLCCKQGEANHTTQWVGRVVMECPFQMVPRYLQVLESSW